VRTASFLLVCNTRATQQHTATYCNTRQHIATQHNTPQHTATQRNTTQHTATQRNTTQYNATQRNTTQHNATKRNTLQHTATQHLSLCYRVATTHSMPYLHMLFSAQGKRATNHRLQKSQWSWGFSTGNKGLEPIISGSFAERTKFLLIVWPKPYNQWLFCGTRLATEGILRHLALKRKETCNRDLVCQVSI